MERAEEFFRGMGMTVVTGSRYLCGLVSNMEAKYTWLSEKVQGWAKLVKKLSGVAHKHLHSSYAGLQKSLQQGWAFMQRVTPT